jgi:hypothetical protein
MIMILRRACVFSLSLALGLSAVWAKKESPPVGLVAVSGGDVVVLVDPILGNTMSIPTGPVAWLFPAPGGTLFAPDLVHGKTTVVDLRTLRKRDTIDGLTMPRFGEVSDRYVVLGKQVLVVSYPERAVIDIFDFRFEHPWQVAVVADNTVLVVLERSPDGASVPVVTAMNLGNGKVSYRRPMSGDVRHFAISPRLGVIAFADAGSGQVLLTDPATLSLRAAFPVIGKPVDLVFAAGGTFLVVALEREDGGGELAIWKIKGDKKQGLQRKKEWTVPLAGPPVRIAVSPDERDVAVGLATAELQIIRIENQEFLASADLPAAPRDVVWCDPSTEGPLVPEWSDDNEPALDLSGG